MSSDAQVLNDVITAFERIRGLHSFKLTFDAKHRLVTIRGRVSGNLERQLAESIAHGIAGLRGLVLEIAVDPSRARDII